MEELLQQVDVELERHQHRLVEQEEQVLPVQVFLVVQGVEVVLLLVQDIQVEQEILLQ